MAEKFEDEEPEIDTAEEVEWYAKLLKQDPVHDCCCYFWAYNSLQNVLNEPLQYCGYCGRRLTEEEFIAIEERQFPSYSKEEKENK